MDTRENRTNTSNLTNEEVEQAAALLARLEPGFLPFPIFLQMCRLNTMSTVELVVLRQREDGAVETWLRRRDAEDVLWPGSWCNPGCIIRPTDSLEDALQRLSEEDLDGAPFAAPPTFVTYLLNPANKRGQTSIALYWTELVAEPAAGEFFDVAQLPKDLIPSQRQLILLAAEAYKASS
jgi:hypothetical protein